MVGWSGGVEFSSGFVGGPRWCCGDASLEGYEVGGGVGAGARNLGTVRGQVFDWLCS